MGGEMIALAYRRSPPDPAAAYNQRLAEMKRPIQCSTPPS